MTVIDSILSHSFLYTHIYQREKCIYVDVDIRVQVSIQSYC